MRTFSFSRRNWILLPWAGMLAACSSASSSPFDFPSASDASASADDGGSNDPPASADASDGSNRGDGAQSPGTNPGPTAKPDAGATGSLKPDSGTSRPDASTTADGGCTPDLACVLSPPPTTGDIRQDCVDRVNQFRTQCACMKPLARWTAGEACADMMAQYDAMMGVAHAGANANSGQGICPWGDGQDECPGYPSDSKVISTCLQQMWSEGPPPSGTSIQQCESPAMINTCYEAHGHFINMTNPAANKIACGFYTTSQGAVWATQNLSP